MTNQDDEYVPPEERIDGVDYSELYPEDEDEEEDDFDSDEDINGKTDEILDQEAGI